jgi:isopentenyl diphosphate isomerase/L-lactate dehydrogenase-like FMN-dependent dehydrogenase
MSKAEEHNIDPSKISSHKIKMTQVSFQNLLQLEEMAKPLLPPPVYGYYAGGSNDEITLRDNRAAFSRYRLLPRILRDVSNIDCSCTLFGRKLSTPILIAPMAMQKLCHPDGELAVARASEAVNSVMIVSTMATCSMQEVSQVCLGSEERVEDIHAPSTTGRGICITTNQPVPPSPPTINNNSKPLWLQIYVLSERSITERMMKEAEQLGYEAIVITVDAPILGKREADEESRFTLPAGLSLRNLDEIDNLSTGEAMQRRKEEGSRFGKHFTELIDPSLTFDTISWACSLTSLPVLVKGVLAPDDARLCTIYGASGIIVSNHGGRQLDGVPSALDMLPAVVKALENKRNTNKVHILVDGGVRRGTDVLKCLALGADAVLLGRPVLWGLTLGGQKGVERVVEHLTEELRNALALSGVRSLNPEELNESLIISPNDGPLRIHSTRL